MEERSRDYLRDILAKIKTAVRRARKRPRSLFYFCWKYRFCYFHIFQRKPLAKSQPLRPTCGDAAGGGVHRTLIFYDCV